MEISMNDTRRDGVTPELTPSCAFDHIKILNVSSATKSDGWFAKGDVLSRKWREVFTQATQRRASDIHVETLADAIRVRARINGEMVVLAEFREAGLLQQLMIRLKEISGFDTSVQKRAQTRAFNLLAIKSRFRAELTPASHGETAVFRIIDDGPIPPLVSRGLTDQALRDLRFAIDQEGGFICVTGPTGSGKSSTLQSCLMELDREGLKVISLEDPIEKEIPGVIQQEITAEFSWAQGIKSAMRQDPDVILIGEIRDDESAALAFQAAQTGHLVLSTLHTKDAAGVVDRLIGLGVERQVVADNLLFASAQRLVQNLCSACRVAVGALWHRGAGCETCKGQGYAGRTAILEYALSPAAESVFSFNKDEFRRTQLRQTLHAEAKRLAEAGVVDCRILEQYVP
jgi:type II secretory ATPase GspE/PulE/Tfp pilus assembly ATPase PilB-like protein